MAALARPAGIEEKGFYFDLSKWSASLSASKVDSIPFRPATTNMDPKPLNPGSESFWFHIVVSCGLVVLGGIFAGYATVFQE